MTIKFRIFASGSNGNSGILSTPDGALLIEAGISRKRLFHLMKDSGISPADLQGILISHYHTDHCRDLPIINEQLNVPIISSKGTREGFHKYQSYDSRWVSVINNTRTLPPRTPLEFGTFRIQSLPTVHDALGATAFYIKYRDIGFTLITDTGQILPHHLDAINNSMFSLLEMNHDIPALYRSQRSRSLKRRIRKTHLDNGQTTSILSQIDQDNKVLLFGHLSGECNSPLHVKRELLEWGEEQEEFPWDCFICRRDSPGPLLMLSGNDMLHTSEQSLSLKSLKENRRILQPKKDLLSYFP